MSNVGNQLMSGACSGFATTICLQPFDLLKTRMQQGDERPRPLVSHNLSPSRKLGRLFAMGSGQALRSASALSLPLPNPRSSIILATAREVVMAGGIWGLWRGTTPSLIRNVPGVAMYMTGLTQLRTLMATSPYFALVCTTTPINNNNNRRSVLPTLTSQGNLLAGGVTRVAVGFLLNPISVLKARFESTIHNPAGPVVPPGITTSRYPPLPLSHTSITHPLTMRRALVQLFAEGPRALLRGFGASALRDAPYAGLFVLGYEWVKKEGVRILPPHSHAHATVLHGVSAATAGALATLATHPFDVVKTKMQVRTEARYSGFTSTVMAIWQQRGFAGYFDGASLRMSRKVLSSAIGWAVYEGILMLRAR